MAKREAEKMNNTARSSKGFFKKEEAQDGETCPFKSCGRKFASLDQLKQHIERRHKEEPSKVTFVGVNKPPEAFATQKKMSNKLGSLKVEEKKEPAKPV
jgi:hypothetical protein